MQDFLFFIDAVGSTTLLLVGAGVLCVIVGFWISYRVIKSAVRQGIRDAGHASSSMYPQRPRDPQQDPRYDFVYTEPRNE